MIHECISQDFWSAFDFETQLYRLKLGYQCHVAESSAVLSKLWCGVDVTKIVDDWLGERPKQYHWYRAL